MRRYAVVGIINTLPGIVDEILCCFDIVIWCGIREEAALFLPVQHRHFGETPELAELLERDEASGGQLLEYEARLWATEHLQNRLWNAEGKRSAAGGSITDRINYLLGYNASRRTALRLVDAGK